MSGYVRPNIVIKALQELCQTLLYKSAKFSIRPNWQDLLELINTNETTKIEEYIIDANFKIEKLDTFEKIFDEDYTHINAKYFKS
jgi:hypothetical protein